MKLSILATTVALLWSAGEALAADATPATPQVSLRQMVAHLESKYGGEVVAIALDTSGDKPAHYHVDMRYRKAGTAKLDVDARTFKISARDRPQPDNGWTSLAGAAAFAATQLQGQALVAELDTIDGASPHYDIDVRLEGGQIARLKVDPKTQQLGWRTPPIVTD